MFKFLSTLFFLVYFTYSYSQNSSETDIIIGYENGVYLTENGNNIGIQFRFYLDVELGKNIIQFANQSGFLGDFGEEDDEIFEEFEFLENFIPKYNTIEALFGRRILETEKLDITPFAGVAFLYGVDEGRSGIAYPFRLNATLNLNKGFRMGLVTEYLLNKFDNKFGVNLLFSYKFDW
jgi:hypothetical protein